MDIGKALALSAIAGVIAAASGCATTNPGAPAPATATTEGPPATAKASCAGADHTDKNHCAAATTPATATPK